jgi:hypothetical protein
MTIRSHNFGRHFDGRFRLHQRQPRSDKLCRDQFKLCHVDHAFASALRQRVSNPARWEAFMGRSPEYRGIPCPKCASTRRRTRDRSCYSCKLKKNEGNWERIRAGIQPIARRSRAGYLDRIDADRKERCGECSHYSNNGITAQSYATGRLDVQCPEHHIYSQHFEQIAPQQIVSLISRVPGLRACLDWAGWSV